MSHPLPFPPADTAPARPHRAPDPSCRRTADPAPDPAPGVAPDAELPVVSAFPPAPSQGSPLTSRREMFCRVYVACGNAADAARRAGYAEGSARQQGWRLLDDDAIRARIEELWRHAEQVRETDRDLILDAAGQLFGAAMAAKSFNAAARALVLQAQLAGFVGPARNREPIVPGRPGPVARARARQAEAAAAGRGVASGREEARQDVGGGAGVRDEETDSRSQPGQPHDQPEERAKGRSESAGDGRPARTPALDGPEPNAPPEPELAQDPWAEAARIARQRELAGVHCTLAALRRREDLASRAALAAPAARDAAAQAA